MISLLQRKSLKFFHPLLRKVAKLYLSSPRNYSFKDIKITVLPGVFHPGLFFSTKLLVEFISDFDLKDKAVLELGAGSGFISVFCAKRGANVTASDINTTALNQITLNAEKNDVTLKTMESDLFDELNPADYQYIIINPPYYPKDPQNLSDHAWFCGEEFEYFKKFFSQLKDAKLTDTHIYMILSEDCDISTIQSIAIGNQHDLSLVLEKKISGEKNFIFKIV